MALHRLRRERTPLSMSTNTQNSIKKSSAWCKIAEYSPFYLFFSQYGCLMWVNQQPRSYPSKLAPLVLPLTPLWERCCSSSQQRCWLMEESTLPQLRWVQGLALLCCLTNKEDENDKESGKRNVSACVRDWMEGCWGDRGDGAGRVQQPRGGSLRKLEWERETANSRKAIKAVKRQTAEEGLQGQSLNNNLMKTRCRAPPLLLHPAICLYEREPQQGEGGEGRRKSWRNTATARARGVARSAERPLHSHTFTRAFLFLSPF